MSAIVVLGSANMDLVVRQERLPRPGETMFGSSFATIPGGKGLNQAVAAARAGGDVGFLGAVGRDGFGDALRRCLEEDGIDTSGLREVGEPILWGSIWAVVIFVVFMVIGTRTFKKENA
jgi:ribokinase